MDPIHKKHIALIVFDDDKKKSPLYNIRTDALEWYWALTPFGRKIMMQENGIEFENKKLSTDIIESVYLKLHDSV